MQSTNIPLKDMARIGSPYVINGKAKNGTTYFKVHRTAQCVNNECRAQIAAMPIKKGDSMAKIVRKLPGDCIRTSLIGR